MQEPSRNEDAEHHEASMEGEEAIQTGQGSVQPSVVSSQSTQARPAQATSGAPSFMQRLKIFTKECVRVFKITKKPDKQEFMMVSKIAGVGILIIGAIGFIVHLLQQLLKA
jgi:protein transport protein SEC61 subunit gamma-like protein